MRDSHEQSAHKKNSSNKGYSSKRNNKRSAQKMGSPQSHKTIFNSAKLGMKSSGKKKSYRPRLDPSLRQDLYSKYVDLPVNNISRKGH